MVLMQAVLGLLEGTEAAWLKEMVGCVINVNVPAGPLHGIKGLHLAHQVGSTTMHSSSWLLTEHRRPSLVPERLFRIGMETVCMQGAACVFPAFKEVFQEVPQDEGAMTSSVISMPGMRTFRNAAGGMRWCVSAHSVEPPYTLIDLSAFCCGAFRVLLNENIVPEWRAVKNDMGMRS